MAEKINFIIGEKFHREKEYTPSKSAETCLFFLQTYTSEVVCPAGAFAGATFEKDIYVPKSEFYWSDDQIIKKYESFFE